MIRCPKFRQKVSGVLILPFFLVPTISHAGSCAPCTTELTDLGIQTKLQNEQMNLIQQNKDYLAKYGSASKSASVKVKSNLLIISLRLEAAKNSITLLNAQLTKKGCVSCQQT